jgi:hypothetical protein
MKKSNYPGQITAAKQVNSRVIPDVSSSGHMSLSTGRKYLQREAADRPENEGRIRGLLPENYEWACKKYGKARVEAEYKAGTFEGI